jgi:hypothetical protein
LTSFTPTPCLYTASSHTHPTQFSWILLLPVLLLVPLPLLRVLVLLVLLLACL